ncbi:hypothetical protein GIV65_24965, partial [Pseudomonas syringae]|nr:hypothetical protein [Pseudomonas syringae]
YIALNLMPLSRTSETSPGSLLRPCGQNQKLSLFAKALMAATRLLLEKEASAQWM